MNIIIMRLLFILFRIGPIHYRNIYSCSLFSIQISFFNEWTKRVTPTKTSCKINCFFPMSTLRIFVPLRVITCQPYYQEFSVCRTSQFTSSILLIWTIWIISQQCHHGMKIRAITLTECVDAYACHTIMDIHLQVMRPNIQEPWQIAR